jgi:hypothetical protein
LRSLAFELKRKSVRLAVRDGRELYRVYRLLHKLGLADSVTIGEEGVRVPVSVLSSNYPEAVFACWLAVQAVGPATITLGADLGERNIGVAVVVGSIVAYTGLFRSWTEVCALAGDLAKLSCTFRVKLGYIGHMTFDGHQVAAELKSKGFRVELVSEDEARTSVLLGDFTSLGKLSSHEVDALKIALSPISNKV